MAKLKFIFAIIFLILCFACQNRKDNAETKQDFSKGSGISAIKLDAQKTEDLALLGKVWGFLKYYHPEVAKGKYNWDFELFKILPKILSCKNVSERNAILYSWIENLGPIGKDTVYYIDSAKVKCYPDLDWLNDISIFGNDLSKKLVEVRNAKRTGKNYYVRLVAYAHNPIFTNEDSCKQFKFPDAGYRLLCLFRYWNCIEYFYPNKLLIGEDWDNVLNEFIPKFVDTKNELSYKMTVSDLIAKIHDSHAYFICKENSWTNFQRNYFALVKIAFVEKKAVVIGFYNKEISEKSGLMIGDIILKIKSKTTEEIIEEKLPHEHASNYTTALRNIAIYFFRNNDSLLDISYQRGTKVNSLRLKCILIEKLDKTLMDYFDSSDTCFKVLSPNIGYFIPVSFKDKYVKNVMPYIMKTKGLIIDFRCYPSDDILASFVDYFLPQQFCYLKTTDTKIALPGLFSYSFHAYSGHDNPKYYNGQVVILVNENTQSQAEWDVMALQKISNALVIGSTTAGADGNVSKINLIGGISTYISGRGVYYPDGRETQRVGIIPDIEVHPTIKGIREGRDELLEKAIEIINSK